MKIENLKIFLAVVRTGNMNAVAESLYTTPQNIGGIIKGMEKELDLTLFLRTNRGVQLTSDGEEFVSYAQTIVSAYDEFISKKQAQKYSSVLDFYTTPALASYINELQGQEFAEKYYLSIHKCNRNEWSNLLSGKKPGIYFLPIFPNQEKEIAAYKDKTCIASDDTWIYACHNENPILHESATLEAALSKCGIICNTSMDHINAHIADTGAKQEIKQINIDDSSICKKLMREKHFFFCMTKYLFQASFPEEEWVIFSEMKMDPLAYTVIFNLPQIPNIKEVKQELTAELLSLFSV